jgi:micrococcal nuclease
MKRSVAVVLLIFVGVGIFFAGRYLPRPAQEQPSSRPPRVQPDLQNLPERIVIENALDGDSVILAGGVGLRYIGIDSPEKGEPIADDARTWNKKLVEGKEVRLEYDEEKTDRYDRLLAYVYVMDGEEEIFVNAEAVRTGMARSSPRFPNNRHKDVFTALQKEAREAKVGVWSTPQPPDQGEFIGSTSRFHRPDCRHVSEIKRPRPLSSRSEALDAGLSPCRACKP